MTFLERKGFGFINYGGINESNIEERHNSSRPNNHSNYPKNDETLIDKVRKLIIWKESQELDIFPSALFFCDKNGKK